MKDTTTWRIPTEEDQFLAILKKSSEITKKNHRDKTVEFRILNNSLTIGSFDRKVTIRAYDSSYILLELSLPKFVLGNNVELLYPSSLEKTLIGIQQSLQEQFGVCLPYKNWSLERLDLCYAWKFSTQTEAEEYLKILKTFDYPRKSKYIYKTSVMWKGPYYSLKFYLKHPEYLRHDYKELKKLGFDELAEELLAKTIGLLRFEITFRKDQFKEIFGKKEISYLDLLDKQRLEVILSTYLNRLLINLDPCVMEDRDVITQLEKHYSKTRSIQLFTFYKLFTSPQLNYRQIYKDHYNPTTIWRNKRDIAKAGVGLPKLDTSIESFSLTIPSDLVINKDSDSRASENA